MTLRAVTPSIAVLRADNPGPMTLDGTRSYVLRAPDASECVVVDPGPDDDAHLRTLAAAGRVSLVLVTHRHADHTAGSARLHEQTGAPVRAADPAYCHGGAPPLRDGESVRLAGLEIGVVATPGHTADSVCFVVTAPDGERAVLTGDTVLGHGTTVIAAPDGSLGDYLASLDVLERRGHGILGLPGHGPVIDDLAARAREYRVHRLERLDQVRAALAALRVTLPVPAAGAVLADDLIDRVTGAVYSDVDPSVLLAARQSVRAQLVYLASGGDVGGQR